MTSRKSAPGFSLAVGCCRWLLLLSMAFRSSTRSLWLAVALSQALFVGLLLMDARLFAGWSLLLMVLRPRRGALCLLSMALRPSARCFFCWLSTVVDGFSFIEAWLFRGHRLLSMASCSSTRGSLLAVACCGLLFVYRRVAFSWLSPVVDGFSSVDAWLFACLLSMAFGFLLAVACCRRRFVHPRVPFCCVSPFVDCFSIIGALLFFDDRRLLSMAFRSSKHCSLLGVACCPWLLHIDVRLFAGRACCGWLFVYHHVACCWLSPVVDGFSFNDACHFSGRRLLSMAFRPWMRGFFVGCPILLVVHRRVAFCWPLSMAFRSSTRGSLMAVACSG